MPLYGLMWLMSLLPTYLLTAKLLRIMETITLRTYALAFEHHR